MIQTSSKIVTFANVEIREYARCLGNNPTTYHDGPSLSLDWQYQSIGVLEIDKYEEIKTEYDMKKQEQLQRVTYLRYPRPQQKEQKRRQQLNEKRIDIMPGAIRRNIIKLHTNCTDEEIESNMKESSKTDRQRQLCIEDQDLECLRIIVESSQRKFKRFITNRLLKNINNNNKKSRKSNKKTQIVPSSDYDDTSCKAIAKGHHSSSPTRQIIQDFLS